jgi:hypothetical protein
MADIEINFPAAKLARVQAAMGRYLAPLDGNGQIPATTIQIADYLKNELKRITRDVERQAAIAAINIDEV